MDSLRHGTIPVPLRNTGSTAFKRALIASLSKPEHSGVQMHVDANEGETLQLGVVLRRGTNTSDASPTSADRQLDNCRNPVASDSDDVFAWTFYARSHGRVRPSYALDRHGKRMLGIWTMGIVLLSVDGKLVEQGGDVLQAMLLDSKTFRIHAKDVECRGA